MHCQNSTRFLFAAILTLLLVAKPTLQAQSPPVESQLSARANSGDVAAQIQLGEALLVGEGVEKDPVQAAAWFKKAAERGSIEADLHLALLYRDGVGKEIGRDLVQACGWYRRAADLGDPSAEGYLGLYYSVGQGVPQSYVEAYFWLDLAASVAGPRQQQYALNRQMTGEHLTVGDVEALNERLSAWKKAHPREGQR